MTRWRKDLPVLRTLLLALVVMTSPLAAGRAAAEDMLIAADGVKTGTVDGYAGGICTFDRAPIPRALIYYIGLAGKLPPPQPQDGTRDEVHLRDGSIHPGPLVSIDADNVVTESASFARKQVAWIWLTPLPGGQGQGEQAPVPGPGDEKADRAIYEWNGTIRVENRYNSSDNYGWQGWHNWRAEYRIKLLELDNRTSMTGPPDGPYVWIKELEPQQLDYEIHADQNWTENRHSVGRKTWTMFGTARGELTREDFAGHRYLTGHMAAIETPLSAPYRPPHAFASYIPDLSDYLRNAQVGGEPGWYFLEMSFDAAGSDAARRALYRGIEYGETWEPYPNPDPNPNRDFLNGIPPWMPDITYIVGRIENPDQTDVSGEFTLDFEMGEGHDPQKIKVEWSFTRTRQ